MVKSSLNQKYNNISEYNLHTGNKLTIENNQNMRTEIIENKADIKKYKKLPLALNNINLNKNIKKPFNLHSESKANSSNIFSLKYKGALIKKQLLQKKIHNENINRQVNTKSNMNNSINDIRKLKTKSTFGLNKGITLYNNMNYNNLYFITNNNSSTTYIPLNKQNFHSKFLTPNFKHMDIINKMNLKRNTRYIPMFNRNEITNINKVNNISNYFD